MPRTEGMEGHLCSVYSFPCRSSGIGPPRTYFFNPFTTANRYNSFGPTCYGPCNENVTGFQFFFFLTGIPKAILRKWFWNSRSRHTRGLSRETEPRASCLGHAQRMPKPWLLSPELLESKIWAENLIHLKSIKSDHWDMTSADLATVPSVKCSLA